MLKRFLIAALLSVLVAGGDKGCAPTQPDGNTTSPTAKTIPGGAAPNNTIRINHSVGTEGPTYENAPRNRPGKRFERIDTLPIPPRATVGAVSQVAMPMQCTIWYYKDGKVWAIDHQEGTATFAVSCTMTVPKYDKATRGIAGRDVKDCGCTPGNNNIILIVSWDDGK